MAPESTSERAPTPDIKAVVHDILRVGRKAGGVGLTLVEAIFTDPEALEEIFGQEQIPASVPRLN